ncbi:hypothetical protein F5141DRAFT_1060214 [Pisolithus sp. B1]|nr:hypothetical protein F5141DRAFT_1060214 [Pisolithus sp. B1]
MDTETKGRAFKGKQPTAKMSNTDRNERSLLNSSRLVWGSLISVDVKRQLPFLAHSRQRWWWDKNADKDNVAPIDIALSSSYAPVQQGKVNLSNSPLETMSIGSRSNEISGHIICRHRKKAMTVLQSKKLSPVFLLCQRPMLKFSVTSKNAKHRTTGQYLKELVVEFEPGNGLVISAKETLSRRKAWCDAAVDISQKLSWSMWTITDRDTATGQSLSRNYSTMKNHTGCLLQHIVQGGGRRCGTDGVRVGLRHVNKDMSTIIMQPVKMHREGRQAKALSTHEEEGTVGVDISKAEGGKIEARRHCTSQLKDYKGQPLGGWKPHHNAVRRMTILVFVKGGNLGPWRMNVQGDTVRTSGFEVYFDQEQHLHDHVDAVYMFMALASSRRPINICPEDDLLTKMYNREHARCTCDIGGDVAPQVHMYYTSDANDASYRAEETDTPNKAAWIAEWPGEPEEAHNASCHAPGFLEVSSPEELKNIHSKFFKATGNDALAT